MITEKTKVRTKGAREWIIRQRLEDTERVNNRIWTERATFEPSNSNKGNAPKWIKKNRMKGKKSTTSLCCLGHKELKELHCLHDIGAVRTLYLLHKIDLDVRKESMQGSEAVHSVSIDNPNPLSDKHETREI